MAKMTVPSRSVGQHHGDLRSGLLRAALALLQEGGVEALTLRAVARRAGVSSGAPYHHFADKDALLAAVAEDGFTRLHAALAATTGAPADRLRSMCAAYTRFAVTNPALYAVMFHPELGQSPAMMTVANAALATFEGLVGAVAAVSPLPDALGRREAALLVWALAHGVVVLHLGGMVRPLTPSLDDEERLIHQVAAACLSLATSRPSDDRQDPLVQGAVDTPRSTLDDAL
jgi:AcrR family transcriptional regulator